MKRSAAVQAAFGLFDDDSSDEEVQDHIDQLHSDHPRSQVTDPLVARQSPIAPISNALASQTLNSSNGSTNVSKTKRVNVANHEVRSLYAPWDDVKPKYIGPMDLITNYTTIGGQRGFVAQRDLEPGTLLMVEQVYVPWPTCTARSEANFFIKTMEKILKEPSWRDIMHHLSFLFPQSLQELPAHVLTDGQNKYLPQLRKLAAKYKATRQVDEQEMLQNVFAMQCNAFESGVFLFNALFNHDCNPNCVKFTPNDQDLQTARMRARNQQPAATKADHQTACEGAEMVCFGGMKRGLSEVRVARKVAKGEPLTISYLFPREQSRDVRQETLSRQFGFTCNCPLCIRGDSVVPLVQSTPSDATQAHEPEDAPPAPPVMRDLEGYLSTAEDLLRDQPEEAASALGIALETLSDALEIVSHDHVVLIRVHKLVADCCGTLLEDHHNQHQQPHASREQEEEEDDDDDDDEEEEDGSGDSGSGGVTRTNLRDYALLFLRSNVELLELQKQYLNEDHIDLARTLNDLSQGIQVLLALDSQVLVEEFPEWESFRTASIMENAFRKDYLRIKQLYECSVVSSV